MSILLLPYAVLVLFIGWRFVQGLRSGRLASRSGAGATELTRKGQPLEFRYSLAQMLLSIILFLLLAMLSGSPEEESGLLRQLPSIVLALLLASFALGALHTGKLTFSASGISRANHPLIFWTAVSAAVAASLLLMRHGTADPEHAPPRSGEINSVTAFIRQHVPQGRIAHFNEVRIDRQSRFVCGKFQLGNGSSRRFFGVANGNPARVEIEHLRDSNFDASFRRRCSGEWLVPQPFRLWPF